jgi:hypothetical protein
VYAVATAKFLDHESASPDKQYAIIEGTPEDTTHEGTVGGVHKGLSLDSLCISIFQASFKHNDTEDDDVVRLVLAGVVLTTYPLPPSAIADLINLEVGEVMSILESIQPLLRLHDPEQPVRPFHKLLSDLLTSPTRCVEDRFYIDSGKCHSRIALDCLTLMNETLESTLSLFTYTKDYGVENPGEPALKYACASWHIHLVGSTEMTTTLVPTLRGFLDKLGVWLDALGVMGIPTDPVFVLGETIPWLREVRLGFIGGAFQRSHGFE